MRSRAALLAAVLLAAVLTPASPARAASPVLMITRIYYDSPGTDTRTNASRNAEYVLLKNTTRARINLNRWTVRDRANHVYTFGASYLAAGATVVLRTGGGTNTAATRFWNSGNYIWNNDTDTAYVRSPAGTAVDSCAYNSTRVDYTAC